MLCCFCWNNLSLCFCLSKSLAHSASSSSRDTPLKPLHPLQHYSFSSFLLYFEKYNPITASTLAWCMDALLTLKVGIESVIYSTMYSACTEFINICWMKWSRSEIMYSETKAEQWKWKWPRTWFSIINSTDLFFLWGFSL